MRLIRLVPSCVIKMVFTSFRSAILQPSSLRSSAIPTKEPSSSLSPLQELTAYLKKVSRPSDDTIPDSCPVWVENHSPLRKNTDIPHAIQNAGLLANVRSRAVENDYKNKAIILEASLVLKRHSAYAFFSIKDLLFILELPRMHITYA